MKRIKIPLRERVTTGRLTAEIELRSVRDNEREVRSRDGRQRE